MAGTWDSGFYSWPNVLRCWTLTQCRSQFSGVAVTPTVSLPKSSGTHMWAVRCWCVRAAGAQGHPPALPLPAATLGHLWGRRAVLEARPGPMPTSGSLTLGSQEARSSLTLSGHSLNNLGGLSGSPWKAAGGSTRSHRTVPESFGSVPAATSTHPPLPRGALLPSPGGCSPALLLLFAARPSAQLQPRLG